MRHANMDQNIRSMLSKACRRDIIYFESLMLLFFKSRLHPDVFIFISAIVFNYDYAN
jgi:hypothetical protein